MKTSRRIKNALGLGLVLLLIGVHRANVGLRIPGLHAAKFAWTTALVVMCVQAATVHVWGQLYMFFFFLAGAGAWMADKQRWAAAPGMHPVDAKTNSYQRARRSALGKTYARQQ